MSIKEIFLQQGILGAIILVLGGVVIYLFRLVQSQAKEVLAQYDKRLEYKKEVAKIAAESAALRENLLRETLEHDYRVTDEFAKLVAQIQHVLEMAREISREQRIG